MAVKQFRFCVMWVNPQISRSLCTYDKPAISTKVFLYHLSILSLLDFKPCGAGLMYLKRYFKLLLKLIGIQPVYEGRTRLQTDPKTWTIALFLSKASWTQIQTEGGNLPSSCSYSFT